ncbi:unnamed protein product [Coccothraustes coccothraustes]
MGVEMGPGKEEVRTDGRALPPPPPPGRCPTARARAPLSRARPAEAGRQGGARTAPPRRGHAHGHASWARPLSLRRGRGRFTAVRGNRAAATGDEAAGENRGDTGGKREENGVTRRDTMSVRSWQGAGAGRHARGSRRPPPSGVGGGRPRARKPQARV